MANTMKITSKWVMTVVLHLAVSFSLGVASTFADQSDSSITIAASEKPHYTFAFLAKCQSAWLVDPYPR